MKLFANLSQKLLPAAFMTLKIHNHKRQPEVRGDSPSLSQQYSRTMANSNATNSQTQQFSRIITSFPVASEQTQHFPRAVTNSQVAHNQAPEVDSLRSRASSVVSTGTRFSISTLPVEEPSHIEGLLGRLNHASAFRPRSVMSTSSYDQPAPPYESRSVPETSVVPAVQQDLESLAQSPANLEDTAQSPTISPENSLSMHYSRVVRTIDQNHNNQMRRLKEAHKEELGATRNAIDQTYRKELKAKAREVERMREEMASLAATHEADVARLQREAIEQATDQAESHRIAMEKACNAIEDLWEARWSERMRLAADEVLKANEDFRSKRAKMLDRQAQEKCKAIKERDEAWAREIAERHPNLDHEVDDIIETLNQNQDTALNEPQILETT